ncbi:MULTISPECIES: hypothetical protein [Mycolicibacterium]|uniref:Uncharacterized protein n=2 Tax=Mycolicibacterium TaxID=1866885 RepID=A0A9X3BP05_9MYCO|nr:MULTISPECIES: hypothetical protein [Mycolicibacterium]MCV7171615.1 hypothetical protein [[Mycobacterium] manitobense]MDO3638364.1 hypothetical protein [Mycolicibacterium arseniciresistens]
MTALQDWLSIPTVTPQSVKTFVFAPLRSVLPGKKEDRSEPTLLRPGLERC